MTDEEFAALVKRLEPEALARPSGYRRKVLALAVLGNVYIVAMLLIIVAVLIALVASLYLLKAVAVKLILVVGFFLWVVLKALWVKTEPPSGIRIRPQQAPELFELIDALRRDLGAPPFHEVLVTDDFNAAVAQTPRLGIFGWDRNWLLVGLPLMQALSVEQFRAVLAHEFGHLAKGHGRISNWIYRQRLRWSRLLAVLAATKSGGGFLFKPFLTWFAPYFNAYSFPLARANEYEADAASARLTSPRTAAEALTCSGVVGGFLFGQYWPQVHKQASDLPTPSFNPYHGIATRIASDLDESSARAWLNKAMAQQTDLADTHPSLTDRLRAIGETPRLALPGTGESADRLLGDKLGAITERFGRQWQERITPSWEQYFREVQRSRSQLAGLNERLAAGDELTIKEALERAKLTETVGGNAEDALIQLEALHGRAPEDAMVCFTFGARLLDRNDDRGCALIEQAMHLDEEATLEGCRLLRDFHARQGKVDEGASWQARVIEQLRLNEAIAREFSEITLKDKFEKPALSEQTVAEIVDALKKIPRLRKAYLLRKAIPHIAAPPCYVLGYRVTGFLQLHSKQRAQEVSRLIQESVRLPDRTMIINVDGANYRFGRKFFWLRWARIV
jgi:Zn-dependent protease with chaperone function